MNFSRKFFSGFQPVHNSKVKVEISLEEEYFETKNFTREDFDDYSHFSLIYEHIVEGNYTFKATFFDEFYPNGLFLFDYDTRSGKSSIPNPIKPIQFNGWRLAIVAVIASLALTTVVIKGGRWIKDKPKHDRKREIINKTGDKQTHGEDNKKPKHKRDKYYEKWF
jgi:hypothetical protein